MNIDKTPYRFEVKIPIPLNRLSEVHVWLKRHQLMFKTHHPERAINSLYLDTPMLARYEENLSGISIRKKVRIRWYGDLDDATTARLEFKHRKGGKGYKVNFDTALAFNQTAFGWMGAIKHAHRNLPFNGQLLWDTEHTPILICRYIREYFVSNCQQIRATFDRQIEVYDQRYRSQANLTRSVSLGDYVLLELKCDAQHESKLSQLMKTCPLRPSRHSKYVNGIRHLMWQ